MAFEFDATKKPEVVQLEPVVVDGVEQIRYQVGNWQFNTSHGGDLLPDFAEGTAYSFMAWYEWLKENGY